jgi:hypothetical protein
MHAGAAALALLGVAARGQDALSTAPAVELPPDVQAALADVADFTLNFDQPGFYAVLRFVAHHPTPPGFAQPALEIDEWATLAERPADLRGRAVTVTGVVGRNKSPYTLNAAPDVGYVWQLELHAADQPLACTLILAEDAGDIPLGATVTVTGYFVMMRRYLDARGVARPAALIVAPGPTTVSRAAPQVGGVRPVDWWWLGGALVVGLVVALVLMRRQGRRGRTDPATLHARKPAPMNLADDLAEWTDNAGAEPPQDPRDDH